MKDKNNQDYGIVYLLTNECMPGLVKIGKTSRKDLDQRLRELYTTGVPLPFECKFACKVHLDYMSELENALHKAFEPQRVNENREFFKINPEQAIPIMKVVNHYSNSDVTAEVSAELNSDIDENDRAALTKAKIIRRPPLNFFEMGLKEGDILIFKQDPNISTKIIAPKKVLYCGEETSLTFVTTKLLGKSYSVQPTPYWSVNGEDLMDIYDKTYPFEDIDSSAHEFGNCKG